MNDIRLKQIWLEVTNVRIQGKPTDKATDKATDKPTGKATDKPTGKEVNVQLKGDKADQEPVWWPVALDGEKAEDLFRSIAEGLDKKRTVLASLQPTGLKGESLQVKYVRVQLTDSSAR